MKKIVTSIIVCALFATNLLAQQNTFVRISGQNLVQPNGEKLLIRGTNLGNWLNPEGYMFKFKKTNSARFINEMLCELVGEDFTEDFWKQFKDNYITVEDIQFIRSTGANTIRLPFHYKLFTDEDYMGLTASQDGFARVDSAVKWCKAAGLYLILDMHDAPGGQTGDNIDDSYAYPWLFESAKMQKLYAGIWQKIAERYRNEPVILGYELLNEPIAPYFENKDEINAQLAAIYKIGVDAIRKVDRNHIILLGGAQWNSNFHPLKNTLFDDKIMYTCHRYGGEPTAAAIAHFIQFRDSTNRPMYMGEIGHNKDEWQASFVKTMEDNNIGWTFWPYKKCDGSSFVAITPPAEWDTIVNFSEADRSTYELIRKARPNQELSKKILNEFLGNIKFRRNEVQTGYIQSLGLLK
ncbi:hypothetical protein FACS1894145_4130 [Bacteroidia bacterium]|nr:hypothetical protein FACS1894145_4130 [Bacteroidia bacterium]